MKFLLCLVLVFGQDSAWVYLGETPDKLRVYALRRSATANADGNVVVTMRYQKEAFEDRVARWEFDCRTRQVRPIAEGKTLDDLEKIDEEWIKPVKDSLTGKILRRVCWP